MIKYIYKVFPCSGDECTKFFLNFNDALDELSIQYNQLKEQGGGYCIYLECDRRKPDDYVSTEGKSDYTRSYLIECNSKGCRLRDYRTRVVL